MAPRETSVVATRSIISPARRLSLPRRALAKFKIVALRQSAVRISSYLDRVQLRLLAYAQGSYQPILRNGRFVGADPRSCEIRWNVIECHLPARSQTVVDLGCSHGYFCLKFADRGLITVGIDNLAPTLDIAWRQVRINGLQHVGFINDTISHELIDRLPTFDIVLFFSVMHHLLYIHGEEWCAELLRRLRPKVAKAMFFDMGQSNESEHEWSQLLPDMGPEPEQWILRFLANNGFRESRVIGHAPADRNSASKAARAIICAR